MPAFQPLVATAKVDGSGLYYLGHIGGVENLQYTDTMPGGPWAMTCQLDASPFTRHQALDPGRRVYVYAGSSVVWEGRLLEPAPGANGWDISADGVGAFGNYFRADYTTWSASNFVSRAVNRGLRWITGSLSGGYLGMPPDSASLSVTDALNQVTQTVSMTWRVRKVTDGWRCDFVPLSTTPTRLLVATAPQVRTLAGYVNALYVKYQATAQKGSTNTVYGYQIPANAASIAKHDRLEQYWDITAGGPMTAAAALSTGQNALNKYQAASYQGAITVSEGQYLTTGGVPVNLACEKAGEVVQLMMSDGPYGGEVSPASPPVFMVGQVKYSADAGTLEVTPYQSVRDDFASVMTALTPVAPA